MESETTLIDRVASSAARRVAILGIIKSAGKATTLGHLMRGLQDRGITVGIVAAGREEDDAEFTQTPRGLTVAVRKGTVVATTLAAMQRTSAKLDIIETLKVETPEGDLLVVQATEEGEIEPVGPSSAHDLREVVQRVELHSHGGRVLIEGSFNRRSFAAPGIADDIILAVGAAIAPEIERAVAGTRYYLDLFSLPACEPRIAETFPVAEREGAALLLGADHKILAGVPWKAGGNAKLVLLQHDARFVRLVLPRSVGDDFVIPLLREKLHFEIVVRDPMRIALSPVYYNAWQKLGGGIRVVHPTKVLALALNPTNPAGPDQDPEDFLKAFRERIPEVPAHDVVLEDVPSGRRRRWFGIVGSARG